MLISEKRLILKTTQNLCIYLYLNIFIKCHKRVHQMCSQCLQNPEYYRYVSLHETQKVTLSRQEKKESFCAANSKSLEASATNSCDGRISVLKKYIDKSMPHRKQQGSGALPKQAIVATSENYWSKQGTSCVFRHFLF